MIDFFSDDNIQTGLPELQLARGKDLVKNFFERLVAFIYGNMHLMLYVFRAGQESKRCKRFDLPDRLL